MYDDIFALLDEETATIMRDSFPEKDAIEFANRYLPDAPPSFFGNNRKMLLYRKLGLIQRAVGQEKFNIAECEFIFTDYGAEIAKLIHEAHHARVDHLMMIRTQISITLGQIKRAGRQNESDEILEQEGVKSRRIHDIKVNKLEEIHRKLGAILGETTG